MTKLRNLKELRWRSRMPALPPSVLEAAKLKIDPEGSGKWRLPDAYRGFLSKTDGGRIGRGGFKSNGKTWIIEGFYAFADAANVAEKQRRAGKLPEGYLPVAFSGDNERPLIFLELSPKGRVYIKTSPRADFDDKSAVYQLSKDFAAFLDMLGDPDSLDDESSSRAAAAASNPWGVPLASTPAPKPKPKPKPAAKKKTAKKKTAKKKAKKKKATKKKAKKKAAKKKKKATKKKAKKKKAAKKKKKATKKKAKKKAKKKKAAKKKAKKKRR